MSITVSVTAQDIRHGVAGCGFNCAIARALQRATEDDHAHVMSHDWQLRVFVWSHSVPAPWEVISFVHAFDDLPRRKDGRPKLPRRLTGTDLAPFSFEIPALDSNGWLENCYGCEQLFEVAELDGEGYCAECSKIHQTT
jgi:hypothetical protein